MGKLVPLDSTALSTEVTLKLFSNGLCTDQVALSKTKNSISGPQYESVKPALRTASSAFWEMYLGSLENLPLPKPHWMSQMSLPVGYLSSPHGMTAHVLESGVRSMSD